MQRPFHYLRRSRHAGFPKRQIALRVTWERVVRPGSRGLADDTLTGWSAVEWSGGPGSERYESDGGGVDPESFWRWLVGRLRRRTSIWVWAFGMCRALTLLGFWERITNGDWTLAGAEAARDAGEDPGHDRRLGGLVVARDPPTIILAQKPHASGSVRWLDVRNLGVGAWPDLGGTGEECGELATWLQGWCRAVDELKLGGLRHTAAAQAWHGWRHGYYDGGILVHGNDEASRLERDSVHPGRAEAFRLGVVPGPIAQLDASSHYPACASAVPLPVRLRWCGACDGGTVGDAVRRGYLAIVQCRVAAAAPCLPCRSGGITCWPVGSWTVSVPWPEYAAARDRGVEMHVLQAALYEPGRPVDRFVSALWEYRVRAHGSGRRAESQCAKLILNSLVGKWASHARSWVDAPDVLPADAWSTWHRPDGPGGALRRYRAIGWHAQREEDGGETSESVPALASWVYSVGRVRLLEWMEQAGRGNVCYVDTDSLFIVGADGERLAPGGGHGRSGLGALRLQGVHPWLRIGGIRDYATPGRTVKAGVDASATDDGRGILRWWREGTLVESVNEGRQPTGVARRVAVPVARVYRHGIVRADGGVDPLTVNQ